MAQTKDEAFLAALEKEGEASVHAKREARRYSGHHSQLVDEWLYDKAFARAASEQEKTDLALDTARRSAAAAERSADAAERTARWTLWASIFALLTVIVSVVHGCLRA